MVDGIKRSISFSRGKGKLTHNDRTFVSPNVDPDRTKDNIIITNESLTEAYDKIFGAAQAAYNAKQKRKDRKIYDYFRKLFGVSADDKTATEVIHNKNDQQSFYEWVVGVGNAYDTGIVDWVNDSGDHVSANPDAAKIAAQCLTEYITGRPDAGVPSYEERNPNFHVVKAIIHMDEKTPHLHIDAVPFSDGYKKGMSRQQGIAKALDAMGYGVGDTAIAKWQESERAVFKKICETHGFDIRDEEKSRGYTVLTRQFGQFRENEIALERQEQQLEQAKSDREVAERAAEQARQAAAEAAQREAEAVAGREAAEQAAEATQQQLQAIQEAALAYEPDKKHFGETSAAYDARIATAQQATAVQQRTAALDAKQQELDARETILSAREANHEAEVTKKAKDMAEKPIADARRETAAVKAELTAERTAHCQTQTALHRAIKKSEICALRFLYRIMHVSTATPTNSRLKACGEEKTMQIWQEGAVINPKRRRNHKAMKATSSNDDIRTDEEGVTFRQGDVTITYGTDWMCNSKSEAFQLACKVMQTVMQLSEEDIIDFAVIETYVPGDETSDGNGYNRYELRLVVPLEVADTLQDVYA